MIAMTTRSSISVKPGLELERLGPRRGWFMV
jgi:hypothetical protein